MGVKDTGENARSSSKAQVSTELVQTLDGLLSLTIDNAATLNTLITLQVRMLALLEDTPYEELMDEVNDIKRTHHEEIIEWLRSDTGAAREE